MTDNKYIIKYLFIVIVCLFLLTPNLAVGQTEIEEAINIASPVNLEEAAEELKKLIELTDKTVEFWDNFLAPANPYVTNSGLQTLIFSNIKKELHVLKNLTMKMDPYGNPIPMHKWKDLMKIFRGGNKAGRAVEGAKTLSNSIHKYFTWGSMTSKAIAIIDPGSKALGYLWAGDVDGAGWKIASGVCKWSVVTLAIKGGVFLVAGSNPVGWGAIAAGTVAAFTAEQLYNAYGDSAIHNNDVCSNYAKERRKMIDDNIEKLCSKVVKDPAEQARLTYCFKGFIDGKMKEKDFRKIVDPLREKYHQALKEDASIREKNNKSVVLKLRELEKKQPQLKPLIDAFEKGTLKFSDQVRLISAFKREYDQQCNKNLSNEYVRERLSHLSLKKLQEVFKAAKLEVPKAFYDCLCGKYSHIGVGFSYTPTGKCAQAGLPCQGGNWGVICHPFPVKQTIEHYDEDEVFDPWDECMASKSSLLNSGMRIDEYISVYQIIRKSERLK